MKSNVKLSTRPKEGDLIYFPLGDRLFEIKYVEHEKPFYQLKNTYVYELRCELFRYEDEVIDTGVDEIDDTLVALKVLMVKRFLSVIRWNSETNSCWNCISSNCIIGMVMVVFNLLVYQIEVKDIRYAPRVAISSAPSGGVTGIATA
jgi:hypothetical protein